MGCQQSKAKPQPAVVVPVAPPVATKPVVVAAVVPAQQKPVERAPSPVAAIPRDPSPVVLPPTEVPVTTTDNRTSKSRSTCSSLASDVAPDLSMIFKHGNLDVMLKRWNQRQRIDAHDEAARMLVQDVMGEPQISGMFRYRSLTPVSSPAQQDLFRSMMSSFASPPRDAWSASPRRQGTELGSLSPAGSPRFGSRLTKPVPLRDTITDPSECMPTSDDLLAQLFNEQVAASTRASPAMAMPASPERLRQSAFLNNSFAGPASPKAPSVAANATPAASPKAPVMSFSEYLAQQENAPASPKVAFDAITMQKSAPATKSIKKAKGAKKNGKEGSMNKRGPVASRWEKGSKSQMQTDMYLQMASAFERQLTNANTIQSQLDSR